MQYLKIALNLSLTYRTINLSKGGKTFAHRFALIKEGLQAMPDPVAGKKAFLARELNGRIGTSEEIAKTVFFAASDEVDYLNGSTLIVDGRMTCCTGKKLIY